MSYNDKRLWLKEYILRNERKMQIVEEEVKKNIEYTSHKYTEYLSVLDIERLEMNYGTKIEVKDRVLQEIKRNK